MDANTPKRLPRPNKKTIEQPFPLASLAQNVGEKEITAQLQQTVFTVFLRVIERSEIAPRVHGASRAMLPPGFEPGSPDRKSGMIGRSTLQEPVYLFF